MRGFRKILMIGLGGSGKKIVVNLKRHLLDSCGKVPPCFRFLVLDTDRKLETATSRKDGREIHLDPGDLLHLELPNPMSFLKNAPPAMKEMLYSAQEISIRGISSGAHGIRFAGRLAFLSRIGEVERAIDTRLKELSDVNLPREMEQSNYELYGKNPEICICGSVAGGTGSGVFIDVAILCRDRAKRIGYGRDPKVVGMLILPWVYENMPTTQNCKANGYAALCELDYFMNLSSLRRSKGAEDGYRAFYQSSIPVEESPFDMVHLIDGRNEFGENRADAKDLISVISDAIACEVSEIGDDAVSHFDNILGTFGTLPPNLWDGKFPHYTSIGIGSLYYPAQEYHAILSLQSAIELLNEARAFCENSAVVPSEALQSEIDSFLNEIQLDKSDPQSFARRLLGISGSDTHFRFSPDFDYGSANIEGRVLNLKNQYLRRLENVLKDRIESDLPGKKKEMADRIRDRVARLRSEEAEGRRLPRATLSWLEHLQETIRTLQDGFNRAIIQCDTEIASIGNYEEGHLEDIKTGSHGLFRRQRQEACEKYAQLMRRLLDQQATRAGDQAAAEVMNELEKTTAEQLLSTRTLARETDDIPSRLNKAQSKLAARLNNVKNGLTLRRRNPFQVLVGRDDPDSAFTYYTEIGTQIPGLKLDVFRDELSIRSSADLNRSPEEIETLFFNYASAKYDSVLRVSIDDVLRKEEGIRPGYIMNQINHGLRLASALWNFDRGLLTPERQNYMYQIVVCGHQSAEQGRTLYHDLIEDLRGEMNISHPPTWSSTDDPCRIVILKYSVSLPAYALSSMREYRSVYELQLLPPPHFDKRLRFKLDDLFPEKTAVDKAFEILTLAIIPEIGVIEDEKLTKGHRYTIDYPPDLNDPFDPIRLNSFVELFAYLAENEKTVGFLQKKVLARFEEEGLPKLRPAIEKYLMSMKDRFESTDFNKQITGKYYYKEIQILQKLLTSLDRGNSPSSFLAP